MDTVKVRRKIEALLAIAQHKNTDPEEAKACLAKIAELRIRYNLEHGDPRGAADPSGAEDTGICWWETHVPDTGGRGAACAAGLAYLIDACGGMSVRGKARTAKGYRMEVVATRAAMALIRGLVPVVLEQMQQRAVAECRRWRNEHPEGISETRARQWRVDYVLAFGFGLAERIRAGNRQITEEGDAGRAAAVVLADERARVQRAYGARFGARVRTVPAHRVRHRQAMEAGRRDGRTAAPQPGA